MCARPPSAAEHEREQGGEGTDEGEGARDQQPLDDAAALAVISLPPALAEGATTARGILVILLPGGVRRIDLGLFDWLRGQGILRAGRQRITTQPYADRAVSGGR